MANKALETYTLFTWKPSAYLLNKGHRKSMKIFQWCSTNNFNEIIQGKECLIKILPNITSAWNCVFHNNDLMLNRLMMFPIKALDSSVL